MAVGLFPNGRCHKCFCATEQQQQQAGALKASYLIDHRAESKAAHDDGCLPRSSIVLLCRALEDMEEEVTVDFLTIAVFCLIGTNTPSVRAVGGCAGVTSSAQRDVQSGSVFKLAGLYKLLRV